MQIALRWSWFSTEQMNRKQEILLCERPDKPITARKLPYFDIKSINTLHRYFYIGLQLHLLSWERIRELDRRMRKNGQKI